MKYLFLIVALTAATAAQAEPVVKLFLGANAATFDAAPGRLPSDYELGGNARASLSPHISLVGSVYKGLDQDYLRESIGARVTATDVENRDFSIGLGIQYHTSDNVTVRPEEWAPDATIGWRPWPDKLRKITVIGQGGYGLTSNQASLIVGARYELAGF